MVSRCDAAVNASELLMEMLSSPTINAGYLPSPRKWQIQELRTFLFLQESWAVSKTSTSGVIRTQIGSYWTCVHVAVCKSTVNIVWLFPYWFSCKKSLDNLREFLKDLLVRWSTTDNLWKDSGEKWGGRRDSSVQRPEYECSIPNYVLWQSNRT